MLKGTAEGDREKRHLCEDLTECEEKTANVFKSPRLYGPEHTTLFEYLGPGYLARVQACPLNTLCHMA